MKKSNQCRYLLMIILPLLWISMLSISAWAELRMDSVYPTKGEIGKDLNVTITGSGFDENASVSLYLGFDYEEAIVGSLKSIDCALDIKVGGTIAYVAIGENGLQIIDISTPGSPTIVGAVDTPGSSHSIALSEDRVYIADGDGGLQVVDISDPSSPNIVSTLDTGNEVIGIAIRGNTIYLAETEGFVDIRGYDCESFCSGVGGGGLVGAGNGGAQRSSGLRIVDVTDPTEPSIISTVVTPGEARDVVISGERAYVVDLHAGMHVIDIGDSADPEIIATVDIEGYAHGITVRDNTAYVACYMGGLSVVDITIPADPKLLSTTHIYGDILDIAVTEDIAYIAAGITGLQIFDVSNPSSLIKMGGMVGYGGIQNVALSNDAIYLSGCAGLQMIDTNTLLSFLNNQAFGSIKTSGEVKAIAMAEGYIYAIGAALDVIDLGNPENPVVVTSLEVSGLDILIADKRAYIADGNRGVHIIDLSDPLSPQIISTIETKSWAYSAYVTGNIAYVADGYSGLTIIDIGEESDPQILGDIDTPGTYAEGGIAVKGNIAYVTDGVGLHMIDISDPTTPTLIGTVAFTGASDIEIVGDIAYLTDINGLYAFDISVPHDPKLAGLVETENAGHRKIITDNHYVILVDSISGLVYIDVADPRSPQIIGTIDTPGSAYDVVRVEKVTYVADGSIGISIAPFPIEVPAITINSETSISVTLPDPRIAGDYSLRVYNGNESYGLKGAVTFSESIQKQKAILIEGSGPPGTQFVVRYAYKALLYRGFLREDIYYLSPVTNVDVDGDGFFNDIDDNATIENLRYAIRDWASSSSIQDLLLTMTGHGGSEGFWLNETTVLTYTDLDEWLDRFQQDTSARVIKHNDSCMSGSSIPVLLPAEGKERIIMTSASADEPSLFDEDGHLSFFYQFWSAMFAGPDMYYAYTHAKSLVANFQTANIDADGDGIADEPEDKRLADGIMIGREWYQAAGIPYISMVSPEQSLNGEASATIQAEGLMSVNGISRVWAVIMPPDYEGSPEIPITDLPTIDLISDNDAGVYQGAYEDFTAQGTYLINVYASDKEGTYSIPKTTSVIQTIDTTDTDGDSTDAINGTDQGGSTKSGTSGEGGSGACFISILP